MVACHVQHVVDHVLRKVSSAILLERVEIAFISALFVVVVVVAAAAAAVVVVDDDDFVVVLWFWINTTD